MGLLAGLLKGCLLEFKELNLLRFELFLCIISDDIGPLKHLSAPNNGVSALLEELELGRWIILYLIQ